MKSKLFTILSASLILFSGCAKVDALEDPELNQDPAGKFILTGYSDAQTKTSFDGVHGTTLPFLWEKGDQIWLDGKESNPIREAGNKASFFFSFLPEGEAPYSIYYNRTGKNNQALIPALQNQEKAYSINLGANGDFGYATTEAVGNSFTLQHYTSYIWFNISTPDISSKLASITVSSTDGTVLAGEAAFEGGKLGACKGESSVTLKFGAEGIELPKKADETKVLAAMVIYPADMTGELLSIKYTFADGSVYLTSRPGKVLEAGKTQKITTEIKAEDCVKDGLYYLTETGWSKTLPESITNLKVLSIGTSKLTSEILTTIKDKMKEGTSLDLSEAVYSSTEFDTPFDYNDNLKSIVLPNNIVSFPTKEYKGFEYARNLETVVLPESLKLIPDKLFSNCKKLKNIRLNEQLKSIGKLAFWRCDALEEINLPAGLEVLGEGIFQECDKLACDIEFPKSITEIPGKMFYNCSAINKVTLHENVTTLGKQAFQGTGITEITLPKSLKTIENMVFSSCKSLEKVINNGNVTFIGEEAFYDCDKLTEIKLNSYMENIGERAFQNCTLLGGTLLADAKTIGSYAFWGCENLQKIEFGTNVANIGQRAFMNVKKVDTIIVRAVTPPTLGSQVFSSLGNNAQGTRILSVPAESIDKYDREWSVLVNENKFKMQEIGEESLKEGIYYKAARADKWNTTLPEKFTSLFVKGIGAVKVNQEQLNTIVAKVNAQAAPVEVNFKSAEFTAEEFPASFKDSKKIKSIVFFKNTQSIAANAFEGAGELTEITLPSGMKTIKAATFKNTAKLQKISLSSVNSIEAAAFQGSGLTSIDLSDVTALGESAFADCDKLSDVTLNSTLKEIPAKAFLNAKALTSIALGSALTTIGESAFEGCNLNSITLPDAVTTVGKFAFKGNVNAAEIVISPKLTTLSDGIFDGNSTITAFSLPTTVTAIGNGSFANWSKLAKITIPKVGLKSIGSKAFENAVLLANIYCERPEAPAIADDAFTGAATSVSGAKTIFVFDPAAYSSWAKAASAASYTINVFDADYLSDGVYYKADSETNWSAKLPADFTTLYVQTVGNATVMTQDAVDQIATAVAALAHPASIDMSKAQYESETFPASFKSNAQLGSIIFPKNITKTASGAFSKSGMTAAKIYKGIAYGNDAFMGCASLAEVIFEDGVTEVASGMFKNCTALQNVTLANSITVVRSNAFNGCKGIKTLNLGTGLQKVESYGFATCSGVQEIYFPDATESIGQNAFNDCAALAKVSFGTGMKTIEAYAFLGWAGGCGNLGDITCRGTVPPALPEDYGTTAFIDGYGFGAVGQNAAKCVLHLPVSTNPEGGSGAYQDHPGWLKLTTLKNPFTFVYDVK